MKDLIANGQGLVASIMTSNYGGDFEIDRRASPVRPFGPFSDFVVRDMPIYLKLVRSGSSDAVRRIQIAAADYAGSPGFFEARELLNEEPIEIQRTALLDLAMMEAAFRVHNLKIPGSVIETLDNLGEKLGTFPGISYELIVRSNPLGDTRSFTGSRDERFFFQQHEHIERELIKVFSFLSEERGGSDQLANLDQALRGMRRVTAMMRLFKRALSRDGFNEFRPYVDGSRDGQDGPSGFRSGNLFAVAFSIMGGSLEVRRLKIEKQRHYYPTCDNEALDKGIEIMDRREDLFSRCRYSNFPIGLTRITEKLADEYLKFLNAHIGVVSIMLNADVKGTAGTDGMPFLRRGVERVEDEIARFKRREEEGENA